MANHQTGEVDRVIMIYQPENFASALERLQNTLGIEDFEGPYEPPEFGLRFAISFNARLELITPYGEGHYTKIAQAFLASHGEGMFGITYRVPDLEAAEARAAAAGYPRRGQLFNCLSAVPAWRERFITLTEAPLGRVGATNITLIQADPMPAPDLEIKKTLAEAKGQVALAGASLTAGAPAELH